MYMTIIVKHETPWPINAKFHMAPPWEGGKKLYINDPGHMTKMAAMSIYGKSLQKSPSELMILKLGMEHYVHKLYNVNINDDPELTLTYLTTMSNLAKIVFVLTVGPDIM